jgi:hypothetical protein
MYRKFKLLGAGLIALSLFGGTVGAQETPTTAPPSAPVPDLVAPKLGKVDDQLKDKVDKAKDKDAEIAIVAHRGSAKVKAKGLVDTLDPDFASGKVKVKDLEDILASGEFDRIEEDRTFDVESNPNTAAHIGAPAVHAQGFDGTGTVVAVLDSGTDVTHVDLDDRIQSQACFDSQWATCPGNTTQHTTAGGTPCSQPNSGSRCNHGTAVAGNIVSTHATHPGVAKDARIVSVRIFPSGPFTPGDTNGEATLTNVLNGLTHVRNLKAAGVNIVAVNLSISDGSQALTCSGAALDTAVNTTWNAGISVVAATGNDGHQNGISQPSCAQRAFAVSAVTGDETVAPAIGPNPTSDAVASYANVGPMVDVFAPARTISTVPGGGYAAVSGTSFSAPLVSGTMAALAEARPGTSWFDRENAIRNSSVLIKDNRNGMDGHGRYRLSVPEALTRIIEKSTYNFAGYNPMTPFRVFDSRHSIGGLFIGQVGPGSLSYINVEQAVGTFMANIEAVSVNVTAVVPTSAGYLQVFPNGPQPPTSNLNFSAGQIIANQVYTKVNSDGHIVVYNCCGNTHILVDIVGVWGAGSDFVPLTPARTLSNAVVGSNTSVFHDPRGLGGVPASGVREVVHSVVGTQTVQPSHMEVVPSDVATGNTSIQNFTGVETVASMSVSRLGADGRIKVYNSAGSNTVSLDVLGYVPSAGGDLFTVAPVRVADYPAFSGPAYATVSNIRAAAGLPAGAKAVVMNLTGVSPSTSTHLGATPGPMLPAGGPPTSNLNMTPGDVLANTVTVPIGSDGHVRVWNNAGTLRLAIDVLGYTT